MVEADEFLEILRLLEKAETASDMDDLVQKIRTAYRVQNIVYHGAFIPGRVDASPLLFLTYERQWVSRYLKENYFRIDPIEARLANASIPVDWSTVTKDGTSEIQSFFKEAEKHGVGRQGLSIPVRHSNGAYGIFTFTSNSSPREWEVEKLGKLPPLTLLATLFHSRLVDTLTPNTFFEIDGVPLSQRELRTLELFANGFEIKQIADFFGLSQTTIRNELRHASLKLGSNHPNQAVTKAIFRGLIRPTKL